MKHDATGGQAKSVLDVSEATTTTIHTIGVRSHEDTWATRRGRAFLAQTLNLTIRINLIILEHSKLDRLMLVLNLFRLGVRLLFTLLATTEKTGRCEDGGMCSETESG